MTALDLRSHPTPRPRPRASAREVILQQIRRDLAPGGVWVLRGPSGIGKTHLARQLQAALGPGAQMAWARGTSWGPPFQPLREAAEALGLWPAEPPALPRDLTGFPAEVRRREALIDLFQRRGRDGTPLVLCCDDLENFDAPSWECLRTLLRRRERLTFSLLLLWRTDAPESCGLGRLRAALDRLEPPAVRRCEVPPLTPGEVAALCRNRLGGPLRLGDASFHGLHRLTGGNPRYLLEIVDFLRDTQSLVSSAAGWRRAPQAPAGVPGFEELVRRRLEAAAGREGPEARSWLLYGALFGPRFDVPPRLASAVERIGARTGYLERLDDRPASFRFTDQRTREAVRALPGDRPLLEPGDPRLAALLEEEGNWRPAGEEATLAAREALNEEMPSEAARLALWADRLLAEAGEGVESPGRLAAAEVLATALLSLGRLREIVDQLGPRAGAAQRASRSYLFYTLGAAAVRLASPLATGQGVAWLEQALEHPRTGEDPAQEALIRFELALAKRGEMDTRTARQTFSKIRDQAARTRNRSLQIFLARQSRQFLEPGPSRLALEAGLKIARDSHNELEEALCLHNLGVIFAELGLLGAAEIHTLASLEILEAHGPWGTALPLNNLALLAVARGEWERAPGLLEQAEERAGGAATAAMVRCNRAMVLALVGDPAEAVRELRRLVEEAGPLRPPAVRQAILFNLTRALLEAGEVAEALDAATVPPPCLPGDEDLAQAALARLRLEAFRRSGAGGRPEKGLLSQSRQLTLSAKSQAWMYQSLWARGDLLFF